MRTTKTNYSKVSMKIETSEQSKFDSVTYEVKVPDGSMFVTITQDDKGKPNSIWINIGKAGSTLGAWSQGLARMMTLALDHGATINDLLVELSNMTSDKASREENGEVIRSSIQGVASVLMKYRREQYEKQTLSLVKHIGKQRPPRLGRRNRFTQ